MPAPSSPGRSVPRWTAWQIGEAQYQAGAHQALGRSLWQAVTLALVRAVAGLRTDARPDLTTALRRSAGAPQWLDGAIALEHGLAGDGLMRMVLIGGRTLRPPASSWADRSQRSVDWHGRLLRRCLPVVAAGARLRRMGIPFGLLAGTLGGRVACLVSVTKMGEVPSTGAAGGLRARAGTGSRAAEFGLSGDEATSDAPYGERVPGAAGAVCSLTDPYPCGRVPD